MRSLLMAVLLLPLGAQAQRLHLYGEGRVGVLGMYGSPGQFGYTDPEIDPGPCGTSPRTDGGAFVNATGTGILTAPRYRYQLSLSAGYYGTVCTDSLRRPVVGLDFRGEHRVGRRTTLASTLRLTIDRFDRTLDVRVGSDIANMPQPVSLAGTYFLIGGGSLDLVHRFTPRAGLLGNLSLSTLQLFRRAEELSPFVTLGPSTAAEIQVSPFYALKTEQYELPVRYRISHYYPATVARGFPIDKVVPAHDISARPAYEWRPSELVTLRGELGLAVAHQPHLCLEEARLHTCSIDPDAPGIRGALGSPPMELLLDRRTTMTFVGELALTYRSRVSAFEVDLFRGYEQNPWAGALALVNRLSGSASVRPVDDVQLFASTQLAYYSFTSPARISPEPDQRLLPPMPRPGLDQALVSPQNRNMILAMGTVGADVVVWRHGRGGPVSLFCLGDFQAFAIRGEKVLDPPMDSPLPRVSQFPDPRVNPDPYQTVWRISLLVGVRLFTPPPLREREQLQTARPIF